jgi:RNA polymerase sigma factor (sigma-70 family)
MAAHTLTRVVRRLRIAAGPGPSEELTDRQLLDRYLRRKDEAAFAGLVGRHERTVLAACRHVLTDPADVSDAFQATFLVLLQNARRVSWHSSLGGWLFAVAHRVAVSARRKALRRTETEGRAAARTSQAADPPDLSWREACHVLHEELDQLRDTYRLPLLLCYLDGMPRDEAAKRLGLTVDAIRGRLDRGRDKLRDRLRRRGITLSAGLFAAIAGVSAATSMRAPNLVEATVAATRTGPSSSVAALLHGARPMILATKTAIALAVVLVALIPFGLGAGQRPASGEGPKKVDPPATAAKTNVDSIHGRVFAPDGKPLAGAKLLRIRDGEAKELGTTAADGRFLITPAKDQSGGHLVVRADGVGIDFVELAKIDPKSELELRTVVDLPVRGRVIDTEGKPVAGAWVKGDQFGAFAAGSLDPLLDEWKKLNAMSGRPYGDRTIWSGMGVLFSGETDKDGRFEFRGLGAERFLVMRAGKAGFTEREACIANRKGLDAKQYNPSAVSTWQLYGPEPTIIVEREKLVRGRVTEAGTGKPRAGVHVILSRREGGDLLRLPIGAWTDKDGNYEIRGARKAGGYMVEVKSDATTAHMACQGSSGDTPGYDPIVINLEVKKGVIITGRMIDKSTGDPVVGFAMAGVLSGNPFAKDFPSFENSAWFRMHETDKEGRFRVVAIAGPVILMGGPNSWDEMKKFKCPVRDPKYLKYYAKEGGDFIAYYTTGGAITPVQGAFGKVLEIRADATEVTHNIELEPADSLPVKIRDADGKPVANTVITGQGIRGGALPRPCDADTCPIFRLEAGKPRLIVVFEPKLKLVGTLTLKGEEKDPVVKLGPAGSGKGRLLNTRGEAAAGVEIEVRYSDRAAQDAHALLQKDRPVVTDKDGTFVIDGLVPGVDFQIAYKRAGSTANIVGPGHRAVAGDTLTLGDLKASGD